MNGKTETPLWMMSLSDPMMHQHVTDVFEKLGLAFVDVLDASCNVIIFAIDSPLLKVTQRLHDHHVDVKITRFEKLIYKGYQIKRQDQSLALIMPPGQLTHLAHCFKYGAYNHHRPESRGNLCYQSIDCIYNRYEDELIAIHDYYRYLTDNKALAKMSHFAYESLVCTVAHKYRLTKKRAHLKLNQMGFHSFSTLTHNPHTGEPYTLKGVRTVLREVDSLLTTDPTTHHHLKKIFK